MNIEFKGQKIVFAITIFAVGIGLGRITSSIGSGKEGAQDKSVSESSRTKRQNSQFGGSSSSSGSKSSSRNAIFDAVPAGNFEQMARTAASSLDNVENDSLLRVLVSEWAKKDPFGALAYSQELDRSDLVYDSLLQMGKSDADGALKWLKLNMEQSGDFQYLSTAIYKGMAKVDPAGTVSLVEQMSTGSQREELLSLVVDEWAQRDVHAVFAWLEKAEFSPYFSEIYSRTMENYIKQSPAQAATLVSAMEDCENKITAASQVAHALAQQDIDHALKWLDTLEGDSQKYAQLGVLEQWAKGAGGIAALSYVLDNPDDPNYSETFSQVARSLAQHHPAELEKALTQMSDSEQIKAAPHLASIYSVNSPDQCRALIQSLQPGPVQDAALESAFRACKYNNTQLAFDLSESITDSSLRENRIYEVMKIWMSNNPTAAEEALHASTALSSDQKENMLGEISQTVEINDYVIPER